MKIKISTPSSITTLVGRGMFTILGLASLLTVISLVALSLSLSDAASINKAGSLRMQSYQIAYNLSHQDDADLRKQYIALFDESIAHIKVNILENWDITEQLKQEFTKVEKSWLTQRQILDSDNPSLFLDNINGFVFKINTFVQHLQQHSEYFRGLYYYHPPAASADFTTVTTDLCCIKSY